MRRAAKVDDNHAAVVKALRQAGCGVLDLSGVGKGCPDLLVHPPTFPEARMAFLMEVKNTKGKGNKLTSHQEKFHAEWKGWIFVVTSPEEALKAAGIEFLDAFPGELGPQPIYGKRQAIPFTTEGE